MVREDFRTLSNHLENHVRIGNWFFLLVIVACLTASGIMAGCALSPEARNTEIAYQALNVIDTGQTISTARNPNVYSEADPITRSIIGAHPTTAHVYEAMAAIAILHAGVTFWLDSHDQGDGPWHTASLLWQAISLTDKAVIVIRNATLPIGLWDGRRDKVPYQGPSCSNFTAHCP